MQDIFIHTLQVGLSLREAVQDVWKGERDVDVLTKRFSGPLGVPEQMLQQLVECTIALENEFGPPIPFLPIKIKDLMRVVKPIRCLSEPPVEEAESEEAESEEAESKQ